MASLVDVPQSLKITKKNGRTKSFSTLDDYLTTLTSQGVVSDIDDLIANHPELIPEIQRHWIKGGQTACLFASKLANSEDDPWIDISITGLPDQNEAYTMLDSAVDEAFRKNVEAIQVIMPDLDTSDRLLAFLQRISVRPNWQLCQMPNSKTPIIPVGLRWLFPDSNLVSWVLGFAPLDSMPIKRRAPFTSIIMRLGGPGRCPEIVGYRNRPFDDSVSRHSVHLADLSDGLSTEEQVRKYWKGTQKQREEILAGNLEDGARARVTFTLDRKYRADLDEITSTNTVS